jgi:trans-AT polyketide synthase/acyltransferase/oxidoreductase domain-containing protein
MGRGLFERYPELTAAADAILGASVAALCLEDPDKRLGRTEWTQPALYVVNALSDRRHRDEGAPDPVLLAGHSLGEYNALLAAGVFDFETGLRLVKRRGELMAAASGGRMAAVLGCAEDEVAGILERHGLADVDVANYNAPTQVVLSGPTDAIERAQDVFTGLGASFRLLNVSAAFHSRAMEPVVGAFAEELERAALTPPRIPVLSNVTARPYEPDRVAELLRRQILEPVRWTELIRHALEAGVEELEEIGPGRVLTKLIRQIRDPEAGARTGSGAGSGAGSNAGSGTGALGADSFRRDHGVRRAYAAGAMGHGVSSVELVVRMGKAGLLACLGTEGLAIPRIEEDVRAVRRALGDPGPFGVNLVSSPDRPEREAEVVDLCLREGVRLVEAAGFVTVSPELVRYRLQGLTRGPDGAPRIAHRVLAKVSRPEAAGAFLAPPPEELVADLARRGLVSGEQAELARQVPVADDLCAEADSGWRTETGAMTVLLPAMIRLRDRACRRHGYRVPVRVGAAGGIGTPEAAAAAFLLGADFVLTGSVNQCTVEAGWSELVKDLLAAVDVQDTEVAPSGELFELGGRVRVLKKGVLFPGRAHRLHELWRGHGSWEEIDPAARERIERQLLGRSFEAAFEAVRAEGTVPAGELARAEEDPRHRMALVFRWYCDRGLRLALAGERGERSNFQVPCGPALGAFNRWVEGTALEDWRARHVDAVAERILDGAARILAGFPRPAG